MILVSIYPFCISKLTLLKQDEFCVLLPPRRPGPVGSSLMNKILAALATRFDTTVAVLRPLATRMLVDQFGKVRYLNGDTVVASAFLKPRNDLRDATFIRVRV